MEKTFWSPMKEGSKAISDCEQVKRLIRLAPAPQIVVVEEDLVASQVGAVAHSAAVVPAALRPVSVR